MWTSRLQISWTLPHRGSETAAPAINLHGTLLGSSNPDDIPFLQEVFQKMIIEHCLGSILCHWKENEEYRASTVQDVVAQFNKMVKIRDNYQPGRLIEHCAGKGSEIGTLDSCGQGVSWPMETLSEVCISMSEWNLLDSN